MRKEDCVVLRWRICDEWLIVTCIDNTFCGHAMREVNQPACLPHARPLGLECFLCWCTDPSQRCATLTVRASIFLSKHMDPHSALHFKFHTVPRLPGEVRLWTLLLTLVPPIKLTNSILDLAIHLFGTTEVSTTSFARLCGAKMHQLCLYMIRPAAALRWL